MRPPHHLKGITANLLATLLFAGQDAITKHLMGNIHVTQIVFTRFAIFTLFVLFLCSRGDGILTALKANRLGIQISRGLLIAIEIGMFAYALYLLGVAPTHTLFATFPLMVTALSAPILGEKIGWHRWAAAIVGFIGATIILQPGFGVFHPAALVALLASFIFAIYVLITRLAARSDSFETSLLYFSLPGLILTAIAMIFYWQLPNTKDLLWLLILSTSGIAGHYLLIKALELAPAAILQPFNYFILVWAIIVGYLIYGEVLDAVTVFGAFLVVASGIYIAQREYKLNRLAAKK